MTKDKFIHLRASEDTRRKLLELRRADPELSGSSEIVRRLIEEAHAKLTRSAKK